MQNSTCLFRKSSLLITVVVLLMAYAINVSSDIPKKNLLIQTKATAETPNRSFNHQGNPPTLEPPNYREAGDLSEIKHRGLIRFVSIVGDTQETLPRNNIVNQTHLLLAKELAARLNLPFQWLTCDSMRQCIEMVDRGEADVIAGNLTASNIYAKPLRLTIPILHAPAVLVAGVNGPDVSDVKNLKDVEILAIAGSAAVQIAQEIANNNPGANISVKKVKLPLQREELFDALTTNPKAVTILHRSAVKEFQQYRKDIVLGADVTGPLDIVWGVRKNSPKLQHRINNFLTRILIVADEDRNSDWSSIKKSGLLRFATYNGPTSYFLWRGVLMGFDYEMAKAFADRNNLQLKIIVVPHGENLTNWVIDGRADMAGASTTITDARKRMGVDFSTPFIETPQQVISNRNKPKIETLEDLRGRTLTVHPLSAFVETASLLRKSGIDVKINLAPRGMSFDEILDKVADGEFDATIEDAYLAEIHSALRPNLIIGVKVSAPLPQGWMVKQGNHSLLQHINAFMGTFRDSNKYQNLFATYFKPEKRHVEKIRAKIIPGEDISPFDKTVKTTALKYDIDWRLVIAQMWQESSFNPKAESPVGAQGLLQIMPQTGRDMGYPPPLFDPDKNIRAGVKYLDWLRNRFSGPLPQKERLWFTLASYNAGIGHLYDAQRLADHLGLDRKKWFGNVEVAMLKLSEPRYFEKARYGYCRGSEPVAYVKKISQLYKAYTDVVSGDTSWVLPDNRECQYAPPLLPGQRCHVYGRFLKTTTDQIQITPWRPAY